MAIEITDEMRAAVLAEQRDQCVHVYDMHNLITAGGSDANDVPRSVIRARNTDQLPHIRCGGPCGRVWLVIDEPGDNYDDAVARVAARMDRQATEEALTPWPVPEDEKPKSA